MTTVSHARIAFFTLGYAYYHAVLGVINFDSYQRPIPAAIGLVVYIFAIGIAMGYRRRPQLPPSVVIFCLVAAGGIPILGAFAIGEEGVTSTYLTWYVAGIATLMAILAIRNRQNWAWTGTIIMALEIFISGGFDALSDAGVFGALMIVLAAQLISRALLSSEKAAKEYLEMTIETDSERLALSASRAAARLRVQDTLESARPLLKIIHQKEGKLTRAEVKRARITEAGLRDQIRGRGLLDEKLLNAVLRARVRGIEVQLLDDGGTDELETEEMAKIIESLVLNLNRTTIGKVVIRSVAGESWTVSMVALRPDATAPDVFLRL